MPTYTAIVTIAFLCALCFITPEAENNTLNNRNPTISRLRARKQLQIHHHPLTLSDAELLMYYSALNQKPKPPPPILTPARRMASWLRRMRMWMMGG